MPDYKFHLYPIKYFDSLLLFPLLISIQRNGAQTMRLQRAIAGLFETIAALSSKDFVIYAVYDTGISNITVNVYKNKDLPEDFDDLTCYTDGIHALNEIHALEDELIEIYNTCKGNK